MRALIFAALIAGTAASPAPADEIEDALEAALEAYRAGDVALAKEEADFAATLIGQMKAESLTEVLPAPLDGWTREDDETQNVAAFGGGIVASATYRGPSGEIDLQLMADNQMVASMATLLSNPAMMASMGTVKRVNRQQLVVTQEGEVQALVDNRILVQMSGSGSTDDKLAYFAAIDLEALKDF